MQVYFPKQTQSVLLQHLREQQETVVEIAMQPNSCHSKWQQLDDYSLVLVTNLHPCNNATYDP